MDLVKRVLGDYSREVVLLLSGTNTAFQVMPRVDYWIQCLEGQSVKQHHSQLFCRPSLF